MLASLWRGILWFFFNIPWLLMALAAAMAYMKQKKSIPLMLETLGALACFLVAALRWVVLQLMEWGGASWEVVSPAISVFNFLAVVALLIFAAGFCWEKFQQWRAAPNSVTATPVN